MKDPYNIVISGVGGQGNVTLSRILGRMLLKRFVITIGETFGASQRGGSVMSHLRVSKVVWSPQIPLGEADLLIGLEPVETVRALRYAQKETTVITDTRPIYPGGVIRGEEEYPSLDEVKDMILKVTPHLFFISARDRALSLFGNPLMANVIFLGAVARLGILPFTEGDFLLSYGGERELGEKAFEAGMEMVEHAR